MCNEMMMSSRDNIRARLERELAEIAVLPFCLMARSFVLINFIVTA